jgi:hypothetical protein
MEDNGARSNPFSTLKGLQIKRLLEMKRSLARRSGAGVRPMGVMQLRQGAVLAAVTRLLETTGAPMRCVEVWAGVEELLGRRVQATAVRQVLSVHSAGDRARFRRVSRGLYVAVDD